jgi:hypothetical protein
MQREHSDLDRRVAKLESDRKPSLATMLREMYGDDFDRAARLLARCLRHVTGEPHQSLRDVIDAARADACTAPSGDALEAIVSGHLPDAERIIAEIETVPATRVEPVAAASNLDATPEIEPTAIVVPITQRPRHGFR